MALTLWCINAIDAVQIFGMGFINAAMSIPVEKQPIAEPQWLFPFEVFALSNSEIAILSSSTYLFMLFGSLLSSPVDKYRGSRPALIWCSICCFLAYFGSSQAPKFLFLDLLSKFSRTYSWYPCPNCLF